MKLPFVFAGEEIRLCVRTCFGQWLELAYGPSALLLFGRTQFGDMVIKGFLCREISDGLGGIIPGRPVYAGCLAIRHLQIGIWGSIRCL